MDGYRTLGYAVDSILIPSPVRRGKVRIGAIEVATTRARKLRITRPTPNACCGAIFGCANSRDTNFADSDPSGPTSLILSVWKNG